MYLLFLHAHINVLFEFLKCPLTPYRVLNY